MFWTAGGGNLYALVPEGKALFTTFDGEALPKASYGYAAVAFPPGEDGPALVAAIKNIIAGYVKNGIPADLVEASKRHEIADATNFIITLLPVWRLPGPRLWLWKVDPHRTMTSRQSRK